MPLKVTRLLRVSCGAKMLQLLRLITSLLVRNPADGHRPTVSQGRKATLKNGKGVGGAYRFESLIYCLCFSVPLAILEYLADLNEPCASGRAFTIIADKYRSHKCRSCHGASTDMQH